MFKMCLLHSFYCLKIQFNVIHDIYKLLQTKYTKQKACKYNYEEYSYEIL